MLRNVKLVLNILPDFRDRLPADRNLVNLRKVKQICPLYFMESGKSGLPSPGQYIHIMGTETQDHIGYIITIQ